MISGVDVSNFQGNYNWTDEDFGFAKATEGTFFRDPFLAHNWSGMGQKGILRGAYHFGHPGTSAKDQAAFFVATVQAHTLGVDDVLCLDLEVTDGCSAAQVAKWAVTFCTEVEKRTGKNCWVYTNHAFINEGCCAGLFSRPLWIADPSAPRGAPGSVHPWPVWVAHQYGAKSGVDVDVLNGDAGVWRQLANLVQAPPKTVTAPWDCQGQMSLVELCSSRFGGTSVDGLVASTVLRVTLANSPGHLFPEGLSAYISGGDLAKTPVPRGTRLFYPKKA